MIYLILSRGIHSNIFVCYRDMRFSNENIFELVVLVLYYRPVTCILSFQYQVFCFNFHTANKKKKFIETIQHINKDI